MSRLYLKKLNLERRHFMSRYTPFVQSGAEDFIITGSVSTLPMNVAEEDKHYIKSGPSWSNANSTGLISKTDDSNINQNPNPTYAIVTDPQKQSKFTGSYTIYTVIPSNTQIPVLRRYRQF